MPRPIDRLVLVPVLAPVTLYRCTPAEDLRDADTLTRSLTSTYELQAPPRKAEKELVAIHMAISTWTTFDAACRMCNAWGEKIGHHVAVLEVQPHEGVTIDEPPDAGDEHRSVWCSPTRLLGCAVDVRPSW